MKVFRHAVVEEVIIPQEPKLSWYRRFIMWRYWRDVWAGFGLALALAATMFIIVVIIDELQPNVRVGYKIVHGGSTNNPLTYYTVTAVVRHGSNRIIFSSYDFNECIRVLQTLQTVGEAE